MVEVYKTNVKKQKQANLVLKRLRQEFPYFIFDFDLEDCDNILRIENPQGKIENNLIIGLAVETGIFIQELPDTLFIKNLTGSQSEIMERCPGFSYCSAFSS